ncbi:AdoMet_MTases domain containing protein [Oxalobacteraceae bacterium]
MTREEIIKKYILKHHKGIEVSPWHNPIVAKKEGYNVQILDIFDTPTLIERFKADTKVAKKNVDNIEHVDFVESALNIDKVVDEINGLGTYDYIISSHNFEHLPNPIKFLQSSAKVLKVGGHLSMAIPTKIYTFDYFRRLTTTADFLEMFFENREKPSPYQIYEFFSNSINNNPNRSKFKLKFKKNIEFNQDFLSCFEDLRNSLKKIHLNTLMFMYQFLPQIHSI